jgi:glycosyltransferase involved in cell wall biosynthesis
MLCRKGDGADTALVTVVISLYNYADYISPCLDSVRAQTLADLDLVVVDDHSADASAQVAAQWVQANGDRFGRFSLVRHVSNSGLARTRNTGFAHAATPFVFVLDADNLLYPHCLKRLLTAIEQSGAGFTYCYAERFGDACQLSNFVPWEIGRFPRGNYIDAMALIRKSIFDQVEGYTTDLPIMGWEDFDLWLKFARAKSWGLMVPEILTRYRVHDRSMLRTLTNFGQGVIWARLRSVYPELIPEQQVSTHYTSQSATASAKPLAGSRVGMNS